MAPVYMRIRWRARQIAAHFPTPDFYLIHAAVHRQSLGFFDTDPAIARLKVAVAGFLEDDFGHGMKHAVKVAVDAGTLMIIEATHAGGAGKASRRQLRMAQSAGLLHDIKRKHRDHALKGAVAAREILADFPFDDDETDDICHAIRNHEAFKEPVASRTLESERIAACLYDADKFRWGPDNFTDTIWAMISFSGISLTEFVARYPKGMKGLERIKHTFRTRTGQQYGPQFIDFGIGIGEQLIEVIRTEFADYL